jgi:hypothetical protein
MPLPLTMSVNGTGIMSAKFEHVAVLPEYPQTHQEGYTYVVNLQGFTPQQAKMAMDEVRTLF